MTATGKGLQLFLIKGFFGEGVISQKEKCGRSGMLREEKRQLDRREEYSNGRKNIIWKHRNKRRK